MGNKIYLMRSRRGLGLPFAKTVIKRAVDAALSAEGIDCGCEFSVLLTDNAGIQDLNRSFRQVDKSTDVLSFPAKDMKAGEFCAEHMSTNPRTGRVILGDIAISLERVREQAAEIGHGVNRELQYLTVHSALHLLGYDHEDEGEEKWLMRSREKLIVKSLT